MRNEIRARRVDSRESVNGGAADGENGVEDIAGFRGRRERAGASDHEGIKTEFISSGVI